MIKLIKTEAEYAEALAEIDRLVDLELPLGSVEAERLEVLAVLVQDYESRRFPINRPDPISAIRFRMEQQGLSQRDLVPYMGSRSKVSEILSGKRRLTLSMIRALHRGLGIPVESLIDEGDETQDDEIEWHRFPIREMVSRGWISAFESKIPDAGVAMREFLAPLASEPSALKNAYALYKRTKVRSPRTVDRHALAAWTWRTLILARRTPLQTRYRHGTIQLDFLRELAKLSWSSKGPLLAQEFLATHGIQLIVEPHLPRTRLDGAAILLTLGSPIVGLTLRHDRIDNFWFCLLHEIVHVGFHLETPGEGFYDNLDSEETDDPREIEADRLAREALIPSEAWDRSVAKSLRSPQAAEHLARQLNIHPAIVAGRMRHEAKNYRLLNNSTGQGEVRKLFNSARWAEME